MEMQCLLVILGGLRLVMFPIYGGEVTFCNFYIPKCNKSKAIIYSKKCIKYSKFRQTSENKGVMRNSLIIKGLEGVKMAVFTVLHLFSRVCRIRHKFNLTNVV